MLESVKSFRAKFDDLLQDLQKLAVENEKTAQELSQKEEQLKQVQQDKSSLSAQSAEIKTQV